jgi:hypothetical protein
VAQDPNQPAKTAASDEVAKTNPATQPSIKPAAKPVAALLGGFKKKS